MSTKKIAILGDGGWGTTLAILLKNNGNHVTLWSPFDEYAGFLSRHRENKKFLPGIRIPKEIDIVSSPDAVKKRDFYIIAVPCKYLRKTLTQFAGRINGPVVSVIKGIETTSLKRPSEMIRDVMKGAKLAVLSGPTIAFEVARGLPTTCVVSSKDSAYAKELQEIFSNAQFRVYTSKDVTGVELGGALKNIIAIAAGISDGIGLGVNTKAAILTRGLVEISRLGVKMGAKKETFNGLSGVGDLATTCMSPYSRNRSLGEDIGKGKKLKEILDNTKMVIEGITTAKSAYALAKKYKVDMPITEQIYKVLYENKDPKIAVRDLMTRTPKSE